MKKILLFITLLSLSLAYPQMRLGDDKQPIDEGIDNRPKESRTKGVTFENTLTISKSKIVLKDEKEDISIFFKEVSQVPIHYIIIREKKEIYTSPAKAPSNPIESRSLEFIIKKSLLQIGDSVIIINRMGDELKEISVVE